MRELIFAAVVLAVFLIALDRKDARQKAERDADREERQTLLQRIQAPEAAVIDHSRDTFVEDNGMPLTDEEMADMEEAAKAVAFLNQFESDS